MDSCDVTIIGAGPYGLAAAAHLRQLNRLDVRHFGETMSFWERHMPQDMLLRSPWDGSHIGDPENRFTLNAYRKVNGNHQLTDPVPVKDFIQYGHWFQHHTGFHLDPRKVLRIETDSDGFRLSIEEGADLRARRVVVAAGIQPFAFRPGIFKGLPSALVTHTSEQRTFEEFRGKEVIVIGGGQSALEAGVFLREAGANVEVHIRRSSLYWLDHRRWMRMRATRWMFYGPGEIGPAGISQLVERPKLFRRLSRNFQDYWGVRAMRPAVARWLKPRTKTLAIHTGQSVVQAREKGDRIQLRWSDGKLRDVDHVILGTGYRVNAAQYPFLSAGILDQLELHNGYPRLNAGFESTLRGLHFLGAPSAWSFGPLMRFVAGTSFASSELRRRIERLEKIKVPLPKRKPVGMPSVDRESEAL